MGVEQIDRSPHRRNNCGSTLETRVSSTTTPRHALTVPPRAGGETVRDAVRRDIPTSAEPGPAGFISYAHNDHANLSIFQRHLRSTERAFGVTFWADHEIHAGRHWRPEIERAINAASVFLLLASDSYFDSDFIHDHEYPAIQARLRAAGGLAIPVILVPCGWKGTLGDLQAIPTVGGRDVPIARWEPPHDGYDRAREQIEESLKAHFHLTPRIHNTPNPLQAAGQEPGGLHWVKQRDQFTQDAGGGLPDVRVAADPQTARLHEEVTRQAVHFAQTAARLGNTPGWSGILGDTRRLADAVRVDAAELPGRIVSVYAAISSVASFLEMDRRIREDPSGAADPLEPEIARELGNLVDAAAIWIRQFPTARALDEALLRWRGVNLPRAEAARLMQRAEAQHVVSKADADTVRALLDAGERAGDAGEKPALHGALGTLNLLYRGGGLVTEEALSQTRSVLGERFRRLLDAASPELTGFIAALPQDIRHAFAQLVADEPPAEDREPNAATPQPVWPGKPEWADAAGLDDIGGWASFDVLVTRGTLANWGTLVTQRLRWIPPGRFKMGSPDDETGRLGTEGPQHNVTIRQGFWMFETACTEALWEAVTGQIPNPSRGAGFPVTNVAWEDAQTFIRRITAIKPGLDLCLPSEAQWEVRLPRGNRHPV